MLRRFLDVFKRLFSLFVCHTINLVETGYRITDMAGITERFLTLHREGEYAIRQVAPLCQISMLLVLFPRGSRCHGYVSSGVGALGAISKNLQDMCLFRAQL
jgi:hypothetical protein